MADFELDSNFLHKYLFETFYSRVKCCDERHNFLVRFSSFVLAMCFLGCLYSSLSLQN